MTRRHIDAAIWLGCTLSAAIAWYLLWRVALLNPDDLRFATGFGAHRGGESTLAEIIAALGEDYGTRNGRTADVVNRIVMAGFSFWPLTMSVLAALETLGLGIIVTCLSSMRPNARGALHPHPLIMLACIGAPFVFTYRDITQVGTFILWPAAHVTYLLPLVLFAPASLALARSYHHQPVSRPLLSVSVLGIIAACVHVEIYATALGALALTAWFAWRRRLGRTQRALLLAALAGLVVSLAGPGHYRRLAGEVAVPKSDSAVVNLAGGAANGAAGYLTSLPAILLVLLALAAIVAAFAPNLGWRRYAMVAATAVASIAGYYAQHFAQVRAERLENYLETHQAGVVGWMVPIAGGSYNALALLGLLAIAAVAFGACLWLAAPAFGFAPLGVWIAGLGGMALPLVAGQHVPRTFTTASLAIIIVLLLLVRTPGWPAVIQLAVLAWLVVVEVESYQLTSTAAQAEYARWDVTFAQLDAGASEVPYPHPQAPTGYWNPLIHYEQLYRTAYDIDPQVRFIADYTPAAY